MYSETFQAFLLSLLSFVVSSTFFIYRIKALEERSRLRQQSPPKDVVEKAKKIEALLYREAQSLEEYKDGNTLSQRIISVASKTMIYRELTQKALQSYCHKKTDSPKCKQQQQERLPTTSTTKGTTPENAIEIL
mmetsp:Transcript_32940/g.75864  ORF Transcript_32940/g.75864 Transcript_32940/m.75864 type:complete len:134 (+) Transcript_32940:371-772(+)